jgi:IMP dehydrogenase
MIKRKPLPKDIFFRKIDRLGLGLTFDDVRLKTDHSKVPPANVSLETKYSRNTPLKIPIVSAAMDTVTEQKMAIAIAKRGGLGIIHKNMSPEQQASEVARVKYHLNARVDKPICVHENDTIEQILNMKESKGYNFLSFPVIDNDGKLVGLLTPSEFDFCFDTSLTAEEVMTKDVMTRTGKYHWEKAYWLMLKEKKKVLPLINKKREVIGMYVYTDVKRIMSGDSDMYNVDERGQLRVGAAIGVNDAFERIPLLLRKNIDVISLDSAHADTVDIINRTKEIKRKYPDLELVVGNISQADAARRLARAGADGVKVGQGPGSICTTRIVSGTGSPQVTAVYECSVIADKYGIPLNADGGLEYSGDIPVAIGAGAHSVMMGKMLAGTYEAPGDVIFLKGEQWKVYRGMGSIEAMEEHAGSRDRYRQTGKILISEGVKGRVLFTGPLEDVLKQYIGGLRNGMGYVGAANIEELRAKADFKRISVAGKRESHPHGIEITEEPPNYKIREGDK